MKAMFFMNMCRYGLRSQAYAYRALVNNRQQAWRRDSRYRGNCTLRGRFAAMSEFPVNYVHRCTRLWHLAAWWQCR